MGSAANSQELKGLETRLEKATAGLKLARQDLRMAEAKVVKSDQLVTNLRRQVERLKASELVVTEHAMLRYLQRVEGLDLEALREKILTPSVEKMVRTLGSGKFPLTPGIKVVAKGNAIVSVIGRLGDE